MSLATRPAHPRIAFAVVALGLAAMSASSADARPDPAHAYAPATHHSISPDPDGAAPQLAPWQDSGVPIVPESAVNLRRHATHPSGVVGWHVEPQVTSKPAARGSDQGGPSSRTATGLAIPDAKTLAGAPSRGNGTRPLSGATARDGARPLSGRPNPAVTTRISPSPREIDASVPHERPFDTPDAPRQSTDPAVTSWDAFDGFTSTWQPADPRIAVGPEHVVGAVNSAFEIFDKDGDLSTPNGPFDLETWFESVLVDFGDDFAVSDPNLAFDDDDGRFVLTAIANDLDQRLSLITLSISDDDDPVGDWCNYIVAPSLTGTDLLELMAHRHTLGVNRDAVYLATDLYETVDNSDGVSFNFDHSRAFFLSKSIYYGTPCAPDDAQTWTRVQLARADGDPPREVHAVPNLDGTNDVYLAATFTGNGDTVGLWHGTTRASGSPLTANLDVVEVDVDAYSIPPDADQPGTIELVATGTAGLQSAIQRDGYIWAAHTVECGSTVAPCFSWYQIDPDTADVERHESWGLRDGGYYYPALVPDGNGEPVLAQNYSSASDFVSIGFGDGAGNSYVFRDGNRGRGDACFDDERGDDFSVWGSRNAVALDPVRGTVWAHAAYATGTSGDCADNSWQSLIFEIDWPNRPGTTPGPTPTAAPPPSDGWAIGVPIVNNRDFRGVYAGRGRFVERFGSVSARANSAVQVQNLDGNAVLNATAHYVAQRDPYEADRSASPATYPVEIRSVPAGGSSNMYLPSVGLPTGQFSLVIESDPALDLLTGAIARTDWSTGGAGIYSNIGVSDRIIVPLAVRSYVNLTSILAIMADGNSGTEVDVEVDFYAAGDPRPISGPAFTLAPYEALMYDLGDDQATFNRLGSGFLGSAEITTVGGRVGAASIVYSDAQPLAVSAFEGVPASSASDTLFVPLFRSRQRGVGPSDLLDTGISVVNPQDRSVDVTVTYYPTDHPSASEACRAARSFRHGPVAIPAGSSHVFYQGPGGGHGLPAGCFGSAVVQTGRASDRVLAIVNDSTNLTQLTAAYNALPAEQAYTKVALPLFRNRHLAQEFTTGIQVMNASDRTARVEIDFTTSDGISIAGCGEACVALVDPNRSFTWYPPLMAAIPGGVYGSAVIKSDEPVLAIVNDYPLRAAGVDAAIYNGIPVLDRPAAANTWESPGH